MSNFFNKDFYPTPDHVIEMMGIDCQDKVVWEPQAGKGNIVEWLQKNGAKEVITCEKHEDLAHIIKAKSKFIGHDCLSIRPEQVSHIDMIVMNPPFSSDVKQVLYMWDVAPEGCEIISLINFESLDNSWSRERRELISIISDYGISQNLGDVYGTADRPTNIDIGLIKLFKPKTGSNEFEGFFFDEEEEEPQENGIMRFDAIKDVVQRYINAIKAFDKHAIISAEMASLTKPFNIGTFEITVSDRNNGVTDRETFKKQLQKEAWKYLFSVMNLNKYVTSGVMKDINKFVEKQTKYPFTMKNIYHMFSIIVGTREQVFDKALEEIIDKFTMHTDENRYNVEGWKTNTGYMLNPKKFIIDCIFEQGYGDKSNQLSIKYGANEDKLEDLVKVICALTGTNYDTIPSLRHEKIEGTLQYRKYISGQWYDYAFFEIKGYKKGTMHLKFKDKKICELLNRRYAKIKGQVLPEKFKL